MANRSLDINPDQVQKLAAIGCTDKEIGDIVGCSHDTLTRRFKEQLVTGRANGKASLRRKQWEIALGGNVSMLIWLGKQVLGQTDKQTTNSENVSVVKIDLVHSPIEDITTAEVVTSAAADDH